jgi:hypothetical protein
MPNRVGGHVGWIRTALWAAADRVCAIAVPATKQRKEANTALSTLELPSIIYYVTISAEIRSTRVFVEIPNPIQRRQNAIFPKPLLQTKKTAKKRRFMFLLFLVFLQFLTV